MLSASDFRAAAANNCSLPAPDVARIFLLVVCEIRPRGRPRLSLTNLLRPAPSREFQGPTNHPAARRSVFRPGASSVLASSRMQTRMSPYRISRHISQVSAWESHNSIPQSEHCVLAVFGQGMPSASAKFRTSTISQFHRLRTPIVILTLQLRYCALTCFETGLVGVFRQGAEGGDRFRYCGSPTFRTSSANCGSERRGSSKKSVFRPSSQGSRS
jgi:hypothetical protein